MVRGKTVLIGSILAIAALILGLFLAIVFQKPKLPATQTFEEMIARLTAPGSQNPIPDAETIKRLSAPTTSKSPPPDPNILKTLTAPPQAQ